MKKINLLFVPVGDIKIDFDEMKAGLSEAKFTEKLSFDLSKLNEPIEIPTEMERAAPWHVCPVTEEVRDINSTRCHRLNYCLMYVIDEVEKLTEENSETDFVILLFPKPPTRKGKLVSLEKDCICVKGDLENVTDAISILTGLMEERGELQKIPP